ncbi:hypothetical protein TNCT6_02690 [Streptomyces sp. 6-11-2]|nr:hypothetical protein TNCT6_02690 [Streptomyces sp. 6-11-2]
MSDRALSPRRPWWGLGGETRGEQRGTAVPGVVQANDTVGVWRADDEAALREKVLGSLPMRPWATAVITAMQSHPNDPGQTG